MQQVGQLLAVVHVARADAGAVHQAAVTVHPDVHLHAEVPLLALLALMHLRVAALLLVLGRRRCRDQRGIDDGAPGELHAVGQQQLAHLGEQRRADLVLLQQVAEVEQRGGIGHALAPQVDAAEIAKGSDVVERVLAGFIAQVEPVGHQVHAQHALQPHRRAAVSRLRVVRLDQRAELRPRHQRFHAREKLRLARGSAVHLKSFRHCKCHLLHNQTLPFASRTTTTQRETCSVFP